MLQKRCFRQVLVHQLIWYLIIFFVQCISTLEKMVLQRKVLQTSIFLLCFFIFAIKGGSDCRLCKSAKRLCCFVELSRHSTFLVISPSQASHLPRHLTFLGIQPFPASHFPRISPSYTSQLPMHLTF